MYKDSRLFHTQVRVGKEGKAIRISKLRSMRKGAHEDFDARDRKPSQYVTKIGKILRRTHLDELPQIVSWLKGDLRLVGIRPLPKRDYRRLHPELKKIYDELGPGLLGIEYACEHFPPTEDELIKTTKQFYTMWKKNKNLAYRTFAQKILKNAFGKEMPKGASEHTKPRFRAKQ